MLPKVITVSAGFALAAALSPAAHAKGEYINSALAAIDSANAQARLSLNKGSYKATSGSGEIVFEIPSEMASTLKFDYRFRSLVSATWEFEREIFVNLRVAGKCVRISVKRLSYGEGGFVNGGNSDIVPTGPCRESEPLSRLNDFLRLSADPGDLFRGAAFVSLPRMKRCADASCASLTDGLPVRRAEFFGSVTPGGQPLPALRATFKEGSRIILPRNGMLVLAANSEAIFNDLVYDLEDASGSALLSKFSVALTDGVISGGQTIIRIKPQSRFTAEEVKFEKDDVGVRIERGALSGELGEGTSIMLTNDQAKTSTLNIRFAKASLAGLSFASSAGRSSLSFQRGVLSTQLENAELWFSDRNSIRVGYTNLNLVLGCPEGTPPATCRPVSWTSDGIAVHGTINAFSTTLVGGQFNVAEVGTVQLRSGQIAADTLQIDSTSKRSPITGKVNKFEIALEGQDLHIDGSTIARVAQAEVKANDLVYKAGQTLPIGVVNITGSASGIEGGQVGKVRFDAGARLELRVERRDGDDPEIADGSVAGEAKVLMDGGNFLRATVNLDRLRYYRGHGDAVLKLTATEGAYTFVTPADHKSESKAGFKAEIDVKSIKLTPTLAGSVVLGPTAIKASQRSWKIDPVLAAPYKIEIPIAPQELVYAPIETPAGGTLCAPKVNLKGQTPTISGKIDAFASSAGGRIRIYDNALSSGIVADADDRGCSQIGALVCFLVGSAFGGPIGGAGLAVLCKGQIDEGFAELSDKVRDESVRKVAESRFEFSY